MALIDNLLAYYKCDETEGTVVTDSTGSYNAINNNCTINQTGLINTSYNLTGSPANISGAVVVPYDDISINLWMNPDEMVAGDRLYACRSSTNSSPIFNFLILNGSSISLLLRSNTGTGILQVLDTGGFIGTGSWFMSTVNHQASTGSCFIYVNGSQVGVGKYTGGSFSQVNRASFGKRMDGNPTDSYYHGKLDEIGVWNKVLTPLEIQELYNSGAGLAYPFSTGTNYTSNLSDSMSMSEFDSFGYVGARTDNLAITDTLSRIANYIRGLSDSFSLTDLFDFTFAGGQTFAENLSDSLALSDMTIFSFGKSISDSLSTADQGIAKSFVKKLSDLLISADIMDRVVSYLKILDDNFTIQDFLLTDSANNFIRTLADTLILADAITRTENKTLSLADSQTISDFLSKSESKLLEDNQTLADTLNSIVGYNRSISEDLITSDQLLTKSEFIKLLTDALVLTDSASALTTVIRMISKVFKIRSPSNNFKLKEGKRIKLKSN